MARAHMSRETSKGVIMTFKTITTNLLTIIGLVVEPIISIAKTLAYVEVNISIRQPPWTVTSGNPVIYTSLSSFFSFRIMLRSNSRSHQSVGYWWNTVDSYIRNSAGHCGGRNRTRKMKCTSSKNCLSFINLTKERYVLCRGPSVSWKRIVEAI